MLLLLIEEELDEASLLLFVWFNVLLLKFDMVFVVSIGITVSLLFFLFVLLVVFELVEHGLLKLLLLLLLLFVLAKVVVVVIWVLLLLLLLEVEWNVVVRLMGTNPPQLC